MADELRLMAGGQGDLEVADLNSLMLSICRLPANPPAAAADWYDRELPALALAKLAESPHLGGFETICVDEFQDIAGNLLLLEVLFALAGTGKPAGTQLVFAGDDAQRILGGSHRRASGFATARALVPDLVHVGLKRNCRTVPSIVDEAESLVGRPFGFRDHRISRSAPGGLSRVAVPAGAEVTALVKALRGLLEHHEADDIVILSPYGDKNSTVGEFLRRSEGSPDERWLRKQLTAPGTGRVRWRSIFKFKGLDTEAVILTDLGPAAREFVATTGTEWSDLLYVGLTRGRYRCVVLEPAA